MQGPSLDLPKKRNPSHLARRQPWFWGAFGILLFILAYPAVVVIRAELAIHTDARSARHLIELGKYQEARAPLERWLHKRPTSAEASFLSARSFCGLRAYDHALPALENAAKLGYPAAEIMRVRAIALAWMGRYQEAEPMLQRIAQAGTSPDSAVDEALAKCYLESFQLIAADHIIDRWIKDAPEDARARYWKGEVARKTSEDLPAVIQHYEAALRLDSEYDPARLVIAELYLESHRVDDAAREYTSYLSRHPEDPAAYIGMAQIALEQGDLASAIRQFDQAAIVAPRDTKPLLERGKIEIQRGHLESALHFLDRALAIDPKEPAIHYHRSLVLARLGRKSESEKESEQSALLREDKAQLEKLLRSLLNAPGEIGLQLDAARWLFDHGHPEEGLRWAQKVLSEHPHHPEANAIVADYYEKQGNRGLTNYYRLQSGATALEGVSRTP
jgi:tetratricopeptide (TPR) repeat protein